VSTLFLVNFSLKVVSIDAIVETQISITCNGTLLERFNKLVCGVFFWSSFTFFNCYDFNKVIFFEFINKKHKSSLCIHFVFKMMPICLFENDTRLLNFLKVPKVLVHRKFDLLDLTNRYIEDWSKENFEFVIVFEAPDDFNGLHLLRLIKKDFNFVFLFKSCQFLLIILVVLSCKW